ncbi:MAG: hypothetical protein H7222_02795 [Methylotenera sp.]|nr:hypothetical protein [Oligoflexia bacterium]
MTIPKPPPKKCARNRLILAGALYGAYRYFQNQTAEMKGGYRGQINEERNASRSDLDAQDSSTFRDGERLSESRIIGFRSNAA